MDEANQNPSNIPELQSPFEQLREVDAELYAINISSIDLSKCASSAIDNPMKSIVGKVKK